MSFAATVTGHADFRQTIANSSPSASLFRLLNVLGNLPLWAEYDRSLHYLPKMPVWRRRLVNPLIDLLIFWTYPQSVEQKYRNPPAVISTIQRGLSHKFWWKRDL